MRKQTLSLSLLLAVGFIPAAMLAQQSSKPTADLPDAPAATAAALTVPNGPSAVFETSMGRMTCQLYEQQAPKAVANFIALAEGTKDWTDPNNGQAQHNKPLYDGTVFHRVIPGFMIQGGDPTGTGMGNPGYSFKDEFDPNLNFDAPGKLAMANSGPNTNGSQFFITEGAYPSLNHGYTLFGQCDAPSVEVVTRITHVLRDGNDKPRVPVVLKKVTIVRPAPAASAPLPAATAAPGTVAPATSATAPAAITPTTAPASAPTPAPAATPATAPAATPAK